MAPAGTDHDAGLSSGADGVERSLAQLAERVARAAGALLLEHAGRGARELEAKSSPTDIVSAADRASEQLVVRLLRAARPDDGILGEEGAASRSSTGLCWVVDPLDGTTNFVYGFPHWAVSIACEDGDGPCAACVYDPLRDEAFVARRSHETTLNGATVTAGQERELAQALIGTGFGYLPALRASQGRQLAELVARVRDVRRGGSAALDLAWVACGRLDGYYEAGLGRWDWAAGRLLVERAGGRVALLPSPHGPDQVVAAGPALFDELTALLSRTRLG